jgi:hypothetical protein
MYCKRRYDDDGRSGYDDDGDDNYSDDFNANEWFDALQLNLN